MSITYPTTIDSPTNPTAGAPRNNPSLAGLITDLQAIVVQLETKVGVNSSAVTTTLDYKLSGVTGTDKAVSKTGVETMTNKTLTAPQINMGSDAAGDIYIRNASGVTARLAAGAASTILNIDSVTGLPAWVANPAASNASTTVKGVIEIATVAEITAGTATGGTGAVLVVPASAVGTAGANTIVQFDSSGRYPAADGSLITNAAASVTKTGIATRAGNTASGSQTIAHGLGKTPKIVRINCLYQANVDRANIGWSFGTYDGTNTVSNYVSVGVATGYGGAPGSSTTNIISMLCVNSFGGGSAVATVAVDATNITLTWTYNNNSGNTPFGSTNFSILWEAQ